MSNLITKYKHEDLYLTTNTNVKFKKKHSSNDVSLAASAILFRKLCRLFHSIFGRDSRGSKRGRRPIEHTGIVIPIPAALPLAQTNRILVKYCNKIVVESKLKAFPVDIMNVTENLKKIVLGRVENIVVTNIFTFSHNVFKGFFFKVVRSRDCVVKS